MKKPDRGPNHHEQHGVVMLREIKRRDLVKDQYRVRCTYPKPDGRKGYFDAMNWRAARDQAAEINRAVEEQRTTGTGKMRFERAWKEWRATREERHALPPDHPDHLTRKTLRQDDNTGRHILEEWGRKPLDKILPIDLEAWLKRIASQHPGIAKLCKIQIGFVFKFARRKRYLVVNPLLEDPIMLRQPDRKGPWVPAWEAVDRLIETGAAVDIPAGHTRYSWSNLKTAIALGFGAGLRISETLAIRWQDVDWTNGVLHIKLAVTERGTPKRQKTRTVPLTQLAYEQLFDHWHVVNTRNSKYPRPAPQQDWPVIWNRINLGKPCTPANFNDMFYGFLWHAGLIEAESQQEAKEKGRASDWRWHCGRAFYISARFAFGDPHLQIMEAVGHADLKTTTAHYARALPEPPSIWRYRFQPADPKSRMLNGKVVDLDDGTHLLPAPSPEGPEIDVGTRKNAPTYMQEAYRLLEGGWRLRDVCARLGKSRYTIAAQARKLGLPPPVEVWRLARDRQYADMYDRGFRDVAIMAATGTSESEYYRWKLAHEAGIERGAKSLKQLDKSLRAKKPVATGTKQKQMTLW